MKRKWSELLSRHSFKCLAVLCGFLLMLGGVLLTADHRQVTVPAYAEEGGVTDFVSRLYTVILGREADEASLDAWTGYLESGELTGAEVAKGFIMSEEFLDKDMEHEEFVQTLYRAFFDREADPASLATWVNYLDLGYRKSFVFAGFANSTEFGALCETYEVEAGSVPVTISEQQPGLSEEEYNVWLFVERMYTEVLKRTPDMSGIQGWADLLKAGTWTGAEVAEGFIMSTEFQNQAVSDEEYVQIMYKTFFGREADPVGLEFWVTALETNSKKYVFAGFANSAEFGALCERFDIERGTVAVLDAVPELTGVGNKRNTVSVNWNGVAGATQYGVWRSETGESDSFECLAVVADVTYTDEAVVEGTTYYYAVSAIDPGNGTHGGLSEARMTYHLVAPNFDRVESTESTSITCTWTPSTVATGYRIQITDNNGYSKSFNVLGTMSSLVITELQPATKYTVIIYAYKTLEEYNISSTGWGRDVETLAGDGSITPTVTPTATPAPASSFRYTENADGTLTLTYYSDKKATSVIVPEEIDGKKVTALRGVFNSCTMLEEVELPEGITSIGQYAFYNCSSLTSLKLPESLTSIAQYAFYNCSSLEKLTLPKKITSLVGWTFHNCSGLTSIELPEGITSIGEFAFYNCSSLKELRIPDSVTTIAYNVFDGCDSLEYLYIGSGLQKFGSNIGSGGNTSEICFVPGEQFKGFVVSEENEYFVSVDGSLYNKTMTYLLRVPCAMEGSFKIPETVVYVVDGAFKNCGSITEIVIQGNALQYFYPYNDTMTGCDALERFVIEGSNSRFSTIDGMLMYCEQLHIVPNKATGTEFSIPDTVTSISDFAFWNCIEVERIYIPASVKAYTGTRTYGYKYDTNEENYFKRCVSLKEIIVDPSSEVYKSVDGVLFSKDGTTLVGMPCDYPETTYAVPDGVVNLAHSAFDNCSKLESVTLPDSLATICPVAFGNCAALKQIEIPAGVKTIGVAAFSNCKSLTELVLQEGLVSIHDNAFNRCNQIEKLYVPASVTELGSYVFSYNATVVTPSGSYTEQYCKENNIKVENP